MSYTPTEWKTGDVITADKLNNMEQGIVNAGSGGGGGGVITYTFTIKESTGGSFPPGITGFDVVETDATPQSVLASMKSDNFCVIKYRTQWYDDDTGTTEQSGWYLGYFDEIDAYENYVSGGKNFYLGGFSMQFQGTISSGRWSVSQQTPQS